MGTKTMVAVPCRDLHSPDSHLNYFRRLHRLYTIYIFYILMKKFIIKYTPIWIQSAAFVITGTIHCRISLIITGCLFFLLPFIAPKGAEFYILFLEKTINLIGFWIKNTLFTLLFICIMVPLGLWLKMTKRKHPEGFNIRNHEFKPSDFRKMW